MKSHFFYIAIYLLFIIVVYYGSFLYMVPLVKWMANEVEEKFRLVIEHRRNLTYNQTSFVVDLMDEYNGDI